MAQGKGYLKKGKKAVTNASAKPPKKVTQYGHKRSAAKFAKKGSTCARLDSWSARASIS